MIRRLWSCCCCRRRRVRGRGRRGRRRFVLVVRSGADSFVNVVVFSEEARVLLTNTTTLVRADTENAEELVSLVQNLEVSPTCTFYSR